MREQRLHTDATSTDDTDNRSGARRDRDRILYSEALQRLVGVTQVVTPNPAGRLTHNRLTHSLKVAQVARSIAERLSAQESQELVTRLGGLDPDVVEAAALAHDLGHPPFGHIGEVELDRMALRAGLAEGFKGNAQSFRIVCRLETKSSRYQGLNLSAATRAAVLKYPWQRLEAVGGPGGGFSKRDSAKKYEGDPRKELRWSKFGVYASELADFHEARLIHPGGPDSLRQTFEASIMDVADDITYALHDLEDFYQSGVFDGRRAVDELEAWLQTKTSSGTGSGRDEGEDESAGSGSDLVDGSGPASGAMFTKLRRSLSRDYPQLFDSDRYEAAVEATKDLLSNSVYSDPYQGQSTQVASLRTFTSEFIGELIAAITVDESPEDDFVGWVHLELDAWHVVQVLKRLTKSMVIARPEIAVLQIGQVRILRELGNDLFRWTRTDPSRLPVQLREGIAISDPGQEGRAVVDFVASLSDHQAYALHAALRGSTPLPMNEAFIQ